MKKHSDTTHERHHQLTIQDDSKILGLYDKYVVLKDGFLIGGLRVTGVNLDLLSEFEQQQLFDNYEAFLVSNVNEQIQIISKTEPVDFSLYLKMLKKRFLIEKDNTVRNLLASYILFYQEQSFMEQMTTKKHYVIARAKMKGDTLKELKRAQNELQQKIDNMKLGLQASLESVYSVYIEQLDGRDFLNLLHQFLDFESFRLSQAAR